MLDAVGMTTVDYLCLGNHEFDLGIDNLVKKVGASAIAGKILNSNWSGNGRNMNNFPPCAFIDVGSKSVLLGGFCTADKSIYNPSDPPDFVDINVSIADFWEKQTEQSTKLPDVFVPPTHQVCFLDYIRYECICYLTSISSFTHDQDVAKDLETGVMLAAHEDLKERVPIILGVRMIVLLMRPLPGL
jgi:hypothetical protein